MFITAQIDLTKLGKLIRENADLVKKVAFRDGEHQLLNIVIGDKKSPDKNGNNLSINCKPQGAQYDPKWYIGDGKDRSVQTTPTPTTQAVSSTPTGNSVDSDPLPF